MHKIILNFVITLITASIVFSCKEKKSTNNTSNVNETALENCENIEVEKHSTKPEIVELKENMIAFRKSLSNQLLTQGSTCLNNQRFYLWHNTPANARGKRDGITYGDLNEEQLKKFKSLMQLFLSADGYKKVNDITVISEGWLSEIKSDIWNPNFYSIDMFGDPEKSGSWGVQLDGHHCVVNFLVQGDNVSIVPAFLGGEPSKETFKGKQFDIFKEERDLALTLYNGMTLSEKDKAVTKSSNRELKVGAAKRPGNPDPYTNNYDYSIFKKGLKYDEMSESTKEHLIILMKEYVYNLNENFADVWWNDINTHINNTYFVWIDNVDKPNATSQFYYRIYNPYLWVEFNTENVTGANRNNMAPWNHIHTITRIPDNPSSKNGGDYGKFAQIINKNNPKTLLEHYTLADHHSKSKTFFDYKLTTNNLAKKTHIH